MPDPDEGKGDDNEEGEGVDVRSGHLLQPAQHTHEAMLLLCSRVPPRSLLRGLVSRQAWV